LLALFVTLSFAGHTRWHQLDGYSFSRYVKEYQKFYTPEEYSLREQIFNKKIAIIQKHNTNPDFTWKQGVNHMTDWTEEEFKAIRGYKKQLAYTSTTRQSKIQTLEHIKMEDLPQAVDWRDKSIISPVKDQGRCGSCWTFGTAETVESHWALATGQLMALSEQQILDCTPNPNQCGGTGGCGGGTAELALQMIMNNGGLSTEWTYPYTSYMGANFHCQFNGTNTDAFVQVANYVALPTNTLAPIMKAIGTVGPLAISVEASHWSAYETGVFDGCNQTNPDLDHEVQLIGYGTDSQLGDYWLVRNSWATTWGELGYIRIRRTANEQARCGIDITPSDGEGCTNGPPKVTVCGTCGILYDADFPIISS